jgi:GNAT superfamily N-acetyltransferase
MEQVFGKLIAPVQNSWYALKTAGWREAGKVLLKQVRQLVLSSAEFVILACSIENPGNIPEPRIPVELRRGLPEDIDKLGDLVSPSSLKYFKYLFSCDGLFCFVATHEGRIIACCWASTRFAPDRTRYHLNLAPWEAYVHNSYTAPEYRRLGVMSSLIAYRSMWLHNKGYRRLISLIDPNNVPSLRMDQKMGFQEIDRVKSCRILWWEKKKTQYGYPLRKS